MWVQKVPGGGVEGLAYAPNGRTLYVADVGFRVTAWDPVTREGWQLFRFPLASRNVISGLCLVGAGRYLAVKTYPLVIWDFAAGTEEVGPATRWPEHVVPWPGGNRLVMYERDRRSLLAYGPEGDWLHNPDRVYGGDILIDTYDIAPDGRTVAVVDYQAREVKLVELGTSREVARLRIKGGAGLPSLVRFSPDGRTLAVFCGTQVHLADVASAAFRGRRADIDTRHSVLAFHPTAPVFAAQTPDKVLTLFHSDTGEPIRSLDFALGRSVRCATFSPDGLTCAVGGTNKQFAVFDVDV
jgi:WD40 repeat protein